MNSSMHWIGRCTVSLSAFGAGEISKISMWTECDWQMMSVEDVLQMTGL